MTLLEAPTVSELGKFTLESQIKLLRYLKQIYKIVPFCEIPEKGISYLILRHDIDFSPSAALKIAQIERDMGIRSTYFVLLSSEFYNVLEGNNVQVLKQISELGHEIGLHYCPYQYRAYHVNVNKTLKIEIQLLEHLLKRKVYSIARHGPWDKDSFAAIKGYINANHPFFRSDLFIHDSCRTWTPLQGLIRLLNDPPKRVQLLIHPEIYQDDEIDRKTLLDRFFLNFEKKSHSLRKGLEKFWLADPTVIEYDHLIKDSSFTRSRKNPFKPDFGIQRKPQTLNYYNRLFRWYLVNTSLGWQLHQTIGILRNSLKNLRLQ